MLFARWSATLDDSLHGVSGPARVSSSSGPRRRRRARIFRSTSRPS